MRRPVDVSRIVLLVMIGGIVGVIAVLTVRPSWEQVPIVAVVGMRSSTTVTLPTADLRHSEAR